MSVVDIKNECNTYIFHYLIPLYFLTSSRRLKSQFSFEQIKPMHDAYLNEVSSMIWEQLNRFWAESYEACKASSQKRNMHLMESRRKFQVCNTFLRSECLHSFAKLSKVMANLLQLISKMVCVCSEYLQQKILAQWRMRQNDEANRLNGIQSSRKIREKQIERKWRSAKRFLHSKKGAFSNE